MLKISVCALFLTGTHLIAQTLVGAGYGWPGLISVAPGQILTFFANGLNEPLTDITVTLRQNSVDTPAPIQSIQDATLCPNSFNAVQLTCGDLAAITVQIPYEISADATLFVSQNGKAGMAIELIPVSDQVHVLTECDIVIGGEQFLRQPNLTGLPCPPVVTHANGNFVLPSDSAKVGEELTAWVLGLGQTNPAAITGQPARTAPAAETFYLDFNYRVNALATKPLTGDPDRIPPQPLFAGLTAGFVGLYQVNFIVPPAPPNGIANCAPMGSFTPGANVARSNFTVSIGGQSSFDGAGICVATQIPVD